MIEDVSLRLRVMFAVVLVLAAGLAGVCPACEHAALGDATAQTAGAPMHGHECCERTAEHGSQDTSQGSMAPNSTTPATPESCVHESAKLTLEAAAPDRAVTLDAAAVMPPGALAPIADFAVEILPLDTRTAANPSPPALLVLPIRI